TDYNNLEDAGSVLIAEENMIVLDRTPFYAESGGQISDTGTIVIDGDHYHVTDVRKPGGAAIGHVIENENGSIGEGAKAIGAVEKIRRYDIMRNHTATYLVQSAL